MSHFFTVCHTSSLNSTVLTAFLQFMRGKARICVATVAFGLGINKADIVGVIHLCHPPGPEHYLQEIGRAGRDGRAARAIALPLAEELVSRHSLAHSDRLARSQLKLVFSTLQKLVNDALSDIPPEIDLDHVDDLHVAMPVKQTVDSSDCKEESIETILSLLELQGGRGGEQHGQPPIVKPLLSLLSVEGYLPDVATITLKKRTLDKLEKFGEEIASSIKRCGIRVDGDQNDNEGTDQNSSKANPYNRSKYQGGTAMEKGFYAYSFGTYNFSVVQCARCMGPQAEPRHVYAALRRLQSNGELELALDTTANGRAMHLRMKQEGIRLFRVTEKEGIDGSNYEIDQEKLNGANAGVESIVARLTEEFSTKEKSSVSKVESMYEIMHQVSCCHQNDAEGDCHNDGMSEEEEDDSSHNSTFHPKKSTRLVLFQKLVENYFRDGSINNSGDSLLEGHRNDNASTKASDIIIKHFPLKNKRLLSCLSSNVSMLMQMLPQRPQEKIPMAVRIDEPKSTDYRNLCIAKILHGVDAPRAPLLGWYNHMLWGKYREYEFESVVQAVRKSFNYE